MTQSELNHAVSEALGEDINDIRSRGFSLVDIDNDDFDPECDRQEPQTIDWDQIDGPSLSFHQAI